MTAHLRIVAVAMVFLVSTTAAIPAVIGIPGGPGVSIGAGGVSASFGGYSASAGLGGGAAGAGKAGGGLFARAGTPDGAVAAAGLGGGADSNGKAGGGLYAGAGLGGGAVAAGDSSSSAGGGLYAGAGLGGGAVAAGDSSSSAGGGLYAGAGLGGAASSGSTSGVVATKTVSDTSVAGGGLYAGAGLGGGLTATKFIGGGFVGGAGGGAGASNAGGVVYKQTSPTLFDNIFSIPTNVLKAVNQLVNTRQENQGTYVRLEKRIRGGERERKPSLRPRKRLQHVSICPNTNSAVGGAVVKTYGTVHPGPVTTTYVKTYGPVHPAPAVGGEVFLAGRVGAVPHVGTVSKTVVATGGVETAAGDFAVVKEVPAAAKVAVGGVAAVPAVGGAVVVAGQKSPEFYNNVFNIPISALNSVRDLLNNLG